MLDALDTVSGCRPCFRSIGAVAVVDAPAAHVSAVACGGVSFFTKALLLFETVGKRRWSTSETIATFTSTTSAATTATNAIATSCTLTWFCQQYPACCRVASLCGGH